MKRRIKYGNEFRMNTSEKIQLHWNENDKILYVGGKKDKIIQREINSLKSYRNLFKIIAFYLKILLDMKILVYLSAAVDFFCSRYCISSGFKMHLYKYSFKITCYLVSTTQQGIGTENTKPKLMQLASIKYLWALEGCFCLPWETVKQIVLWHLELVISMQIVDQFLFKEFLLSQTK